MKVIPIVISSALLLFGNAMSQAQSPALTKAEPAFRPHPDVDVAGTGTADYLPLWTSPNGLGNSIAFQKGADIGIGTTAPSATLDVNGSINAATGYNLGGSIFAIGSPATGNVFLGFAGNTTTTGNALTASGRGALLANTNGNYNSANGFHALYSNTTGAENTAIGMEALQANTTGNDNTASGVEALVYNTTGGSNTADGNAALFLNTTGGANTANGYQALLYNTSGYYNTASGFGALLYNKTGNYNTALGQGAGPDVHSTNLTNATAIGANAVVSQSNSLVLGAPGVKVGIGTATPSNVFTIAKGAGSAVADGWSTYSSRRWKTNIVTLHGALAKVEQLRGVSYDLQANGKHEVGVIAEEVGAIVPELVTWDNNGKDAQSVDYSRLTALLIESTKEQQVLIERQQKQIAELTSQMNIIKASLETSRPAGSELAAANIALAPVQK